ncbi:MAG TPA: bifunctional diaminohydroxyphosphoribosylaminopyrimidine deaminase/5-amino-6-(5-phosphoribosylamino)uracil reductase RibD [Bacillota bacterium]|nr:bifunctional diaminohydroxyphosphoribosylaminopyrimidine deaminase/5-amino-6-(5-phosphoribosylamino)uracil reductase RibD [Bacillota bacterium]HOA35367.1 bifunctional diaminohydroxyphosphoribosylaminopyrimidine deaminase/5-amino-6-(5-phosphoribosylamino)uracil reductase RibD [Bacillota bacterium]HOL14915.1 bifunctional diaminohydroxyphosphoribosylaminopyrimidine deaminase/5-amino-6-(5-phosphoribosylamino)uracil reductase RibD [Bacillota bacterium]HPZ11533.1 bifunctional diaminohydroxyphosphor
MDIDERFMWIALDLARRGRGSTSPNPMVGAVVVRDGKIVGTGYHQAPGGPHAEVAALRQAGEKARGAVLYVNLEPCAHRGRTGPCADAIIRAGISRVVAAMEDPNPLVAGKGFRKLAEAGIELKRGVLEEKALRLNEVYVKFITTGRPFVIVKTAVTADGKTATRTGRSRWITGEKARAFVHRLRHNSDAIAVGIDTVLRDDPLLTARLEGGGGRDPLRVIVDSRARLPLDARVINSASRAATLLAVTPAAPADKLRALEEKGVEILLLPGREGRVDLDALMRKLGERGVCQLMVEGGGNLNYSLLEAGLVDKLMLFMAPLIIGGRESPTSFEGAGVARLEEAWRLKDMEIKQYDGDLLLIGYPLAPEKRNAEKGGGF